jgi:hypothetical protein
MAKYEVSPEVNAAVKQYAEKKGISGDEAVEKLITTAVGRLNAVTTYAKKKAGETKPAKKAPAKKAKAKGPIARKAKVAAE